jgi:hypothetical protein
MLRILTHSRAAKLKLTARTGQSIPSRPKSGKGNSALNSHPTPTPTQPHMSAFWTASPPLNVLLLCAFPSSGRSGHCCQPHMSAFWTASPPLRVLLLSALSCLWPIRALLHCARDFPARCCWTPRRYRRRPRRKAPEGGNPGRRSGPSATRKQAQVPQRPLVLSAAICFLFSLCVFKSQVLRLFWCWPRGHQRGKPKLPSPTPPSEMSKQQFIQGADKLQLRA